MKVLNLHYKGNWVTLPSSVFKSLQDNIRYNILPLSYRTFDSATQCWHVYYTKLPELVGFAKKHYDHINWSTLPADWQMMAVGGTAINIKPIEVDLYAVLFLTSNAPLEVIKASYKALALLHHPDHGGKVEDMVTINNAYEKIIKHLS
jgi:hypothetical protein